MSSFWNRRNNQRKVDKTVLYRNGATLLEKFITSCYGKYNPISTGFSAEEIATNNCETYDAFGKLYQGFLQNRPISVMKFEGNTGHEYCFNNIVYASQMRQKNVLKLIGCCLETEIPILVFETVQNGTLADRLYGCNQPQFEPLLWKHRLKIAMEIANAVTYLHIGLRRPIVYCNIEPSSILFDEHNVAKLFNFSLSESIPEGETHIKDAILRGTMGFVAPEHIYSHCLNEKCDVYSFGGLLLVLLTGQKIYGLGRDPVMLSDYVKEHKASNRLHEIVDSIIVQGGLCLRREQQIHAFTELALNCVSESTEERPAMIEAAQQLRRLYLSAN